MKALLLLTSLCFADAPVAKITGPDKANQGDIVVLSVSGAPKHAKWKVDASGVNVPRDTAVADLEKTAEVLREAGFDVQAPKNDEPPIYLELDKGKRLILSSYPGVYLVSLIVGNDDGVDAQTFKVVVGEVKPPKPVPPKPDDPDPPTPIPVPTSTIGMLTYSGVLLAPQKAGFEKIAEVYKTAAKGAAGFPSVEALLKSVFDGTHKLDAGTVAAWTPIGRVLEAQLDVMRDAREIDTTKPATYEKPLLDIANGILKGIE